MQNEKLLYKVIWDVAKKYHFRFEELLGEGWLSWQKTLSTFDSERGNLSPYMWAGVTSLIKYNIEKERKYLATESEKSNFLDEIPDNRTYNEFEFPETLSETSKEVAKAALNMYDKSNKIPSKEKLTNSLLSQGWKWETIRASYHELAQYF